MSRVALEPARGAVRGFALRVSTAALLAAAFGSLPHRAEAASALCKASEQIVFSCPTRGGRLIAVCTGEAGLHYRSGTGSQLELDLRDPGPWQPDAFRRYHYFRAGVDRNWLQIETAGASYEVFDEHEAPLRPSAGVRVTLKQGTRPLTRACTARPEAHWYRIEGKVACSDEAVNSCTPPPRR